MYKLVIFATLMAVAAAKPGIHSVAYPAAYTAPVAALTAPAYTAPIAYAAPGYAPAYTSAAFSAPVVASYTAPVAAAYTTPVAAAYTAPVAAAYTALLK